MITPVVEVMIKPSEETATITVFEITPRGRTAIIRPGTYLEINPAPGVWIAGEYSYSYDKQYHEWLWQGQHNRYVGLLEGMVVRVDARVLQVP
jgi:hypothetical protein